MNTSGQVICSDIDRTRSYIAFALVELDVHSVKVQSVNESQSSLNSVLSLDKSSRVSCISWIDCGDQSLVAIGLTKGSVLIFSPQMGQVLVELTTPYNMAISDVHVSALTNTLWTSLINGYIIEWDLNKYKQLGSFSFNDLLENAESISKISTIKYNDRTHILVASHSVYLVDIDSNCIVRSFPAHIQPINRIIHVESDPDLFITSATGDRFINLCSVNKTTAKSIFVSQSSVKAISSYSREDNLSALCALTEDGTIEVFNDFLGEQAVIQEVQSKKKRKHQANVVKSHTPSGTFKVCRPENETKHASDSVVPIESISMDRNTVLFSWVENASVMYFDVMSWLDERGNYKVNTHISVPRGRPFLKPTSHEINGHDVAAAKHYNEGNAIVSEGNNFKDLEVDDDDVEEESLAEKLEKLSSDTKQKKTKKGKHDFKHNAVTLVTLLSQALRNNDHSLLETVLSYRDPTVIQQTISKLDSSLAVILLDRMSERITRHSSRFDQLNFWLKWIIIIHGSILAAIPNLSSKLADLHAILCKKADTLPRLMELQGRINLVYQQNELKQEILQEYPLDDVDNDESEVEYIEELDDAILEENSQSNGYATDDMEDIDEEHDDFSEEIDVNGGNESDSSDEEDREADEKDSHSEDEKAAYSDVEADT